MDAYPLPDVVLEVDHTTDVRRRKLGIYAAASGLAELRELIGACSNESIVEAALACIDLADFRRRVGERRSPRDET